MIPRYFSLGLVFALAACAGHATTSSPDSIPAVPQAERHAAVTTAGSSVTVTKLEPPSGYTLFTVFIGTTSGTISEILFKTATQPQATYAKVGSTLFPLDGTQDFPEARVSTVSDTGEIGGSVCSPNANPVSNCKPAIWIPPTSAPQVLPTRNRLWGAVVNSINKYGVAVGEGMAASQPTHAYEWRGGRLNDLGIGDAVAINNSNQIAGTLSNPYREEATFYLGLDQYRPLGVLVPGGGSMAAVLNDAGVVAGEGSIDQRDHYSQEIEFNPFIYQNGVMHDITVPCCGAFLSAAASGINDSNDVVGWYGIDNGIANVDHAFLYSQGTRTDLDSLLPAGSPWHLTVPTGLDDSGDIVGFGEYNGQSALFLMQRH